MLLRKLIAATALALGCSSSPPPLEAPALESSITQRSDSQIRTISLIGTNDLHGRIESLPILGGYLANLRARRATDGAVLLVDAGDMFQGTLESNLTEGAVVIDAYHALGYAAVALGNHELDFGQAALRARIEQARFPILSANLVDEESRAPIDWKKLERSVLIELAGKRIGLVGALTEETPEVVMPALFEGLDVSPIAPAVLSEAKALRAQGAELVVLVAHAGGSCTALDEPRAAESCEADAEIVRVLRSLPPRTVDVVVAGHTHQAMAHFIEGVAVVEAWAYGRAFARVDVRLGAGTPQIEIHPPRELCREKQRFSECAPGDYEGAPVRADGRISAVIAPALERAAEKRAQPIGVVVKSPVRESFAEPSALGNLFADLLRESVSGADAAIMNGGGLRAALPEGPLSYGELHEAMPFDNALALVRLSGKELARVLSAHLTSKDHGILSVSGIRLKARCAGGALRVELFRAGGKRIDDDEPLRVVVSDYLATGGDDLFEPIALTQQRVEIKPQLMRDAFAARLGERGGSLDGRSTELLDPARPRLAFPGRRPVSCD